jgi:hypothetical protein
MTGLDLASTCVAVAREARGRDCWVLRDSSGFKSSLLLGSGSLAGDRSLALDPGGPGAGSLGGPGGPGGSGPDGWAQARPTTRRRANSQRAFIWVCKMFFTGDAARRNPLR